MRRKRNKKVIVVLLIFLIALGGGGYALIQFSDEENDYSSEDSEASGGASGDSDKLKVLIYPDKKMDVKSPMFNRNRMVSVTAEVKDLKSSRKVTLSGSALKGNPRNQHLKLYDKNNHPPIYTHNAYGYGFVSIQDGIIIDIGSFAGADLSWVSENYDRNVKLMSIGPEYKNENIEYYKKAAVVNKRTDPDTNKVYCGVDYILGDEVLMRAYTQGNCEGYSSTRCIVNYTSNYIIKVRKIVENRAKTENCVSRTKIGLVEWDLDRLDLLLKKLKDIRSDSNDPNRSYAYIDVIQGETYPTPWAYKLNVEKIIVDLKNKYQVSEAGMWYMDTYDALGRNTSGIDHVVLGDTSGWWGTFIDGKTIPKTNPDFPDAYKYHKKTNACHQSFSRTCHPYIGVTQSLLDEMGADFNKNKAYGYANFRFWNTSLQPGNLVITVKDKDGSAVASKTLRIVSSNNKSVASNTLCVRNCSGKVCGDDGCGGSCGSCAKGEVCTKENKCEKYILTCSSNLNVTCNGSKGVFSWSAIEGADKYLVRINKAPKEDWANPDAGDFSKVIEGTSLEAQLESRAEYVEWSVQGIKDSEVYPYPGCMEKKEVSFSCPAGKVSVDLDGNGKVDGKDYGIILSDWADYYDNNKLNNRSDLNGNGKIDGPDYTLFLQGWSDYFDNK